MPEMAPERSIVHVHLRPDGTAERASASTDRPTTVIVHRPRVPATVLPWGLYLPRSVLLLPRAHEAHPWGAVVSLLRFLQNHLDHGALFVGHREASEPAESGELRARALLHFLRDEQAAWVDIAAAHGRVQDTQAFLQYLSHARGWDTSVPTLSDRADSATARAVETFQRTYNLAFRGDIHEDGIIGEQTLGAVFEVAKAELVHWMELHETSLDALSFFRAERPTMAAEPEFGGQPFVQLLAIPVADRYDLDFEPAGAGIFRVARLTPLPVEEIAAPVFNVLRLRLVDEWGQPLKRQAYELTVNGNTRLGETDERGMLAEPFLPAGPVTMRLGDGAPVLFHDLYEPRRPSEPESDEDLAVLYGDGADDDEDDDGDRFDEDDEDDEDNEDDEDDDAAGDDALAYEGHAPD